MLPTKIDATKQNDAINQNDATTQNDAINQNDATTQNDARNLKKHVSLQVRVTSS